MSMVSNHHTDQSPHIEISSMHCHGITSTRLIDAGLKSAEGRKLGCFKSTANNALLILQISSKPVM